MLYDAYRAVLPYDSSLSVNEFVLHYQFHHSPIKINSKNDDTYLRIHFYLFMKNIKRANIDSKNGFISH